MMYRRTGAGRASLRRRSARFELSKRLARLDGKAGYSKG